MVNDRDMRDANMLLDIYGPRMTATKPERNPPCVMRGVSEGIYPIMERWALSPDAQVTLQYATGPETQVVVLVTGPEHRTGQVHELMRLMNEEHPQYEFIELGRNMFEELQAYEEQMKIPRSMMFEIDSISPPDRVLSAKHMNKSYFYRPRSERVPHMKRAGFDKQRKPY